MSKELESERDRLIDEVECLSKNEEYDAAFKPCLELANNGYEHAQSLLGWMYLCGEGTQKSIEQAKHWFELAAERGNAQALWYLGKIYFERGDSKAAIECFEKSAEKGYAPALVRLAGHYQHGTGVKQDKRKAFELFERANEKGHFKGQAEYAKRLIIGYKGLREIPKGLYLFINWFSRLRKVNLDNPEEDRIVW